MVTTHHWISSGVRTDPGKVWKVLEFNVDICKALEKSGKILEIHNADLENADVFNTLDYPCICNFSCSSQHKASEVQKFWVPYVRVEGYIV